MGDHYQTLGVPPAATDREIKKAYFGLVRQFPPETHAEDFRRIREAYEALSNPETRAEHDRALAAGGEVEPFSEHGPELGAQMRAAAAALNADRPKEAVPILESAQTTHPDVVEVRDMLGVALMMSGELRRAAQQFEELTRRVPDNPLFHVRLGHCYRDLKFDRPALAAYLKARELAPGEQAIRFVLSDFHASRRKWKEALEELDQAARLAEGRAERDWEPALRRVGVQLARKKTRLVTQEVQALVAALPGDEEVRRHISDRLSSMAARAFALQRPTDGNYLLEVAQALKPQRALGHFPDRINVRVDRLPEQTQAWLREQPEHDVVKSLWSRGYAEPLAILAASLPLLFLGGVMLQASAETSRLWGLWEWLPVAGFHAAGAWFLLAGVRRIRTAARSPLGKFTTLHPLYLVQANLDRVSLWPLINLVKISTTHHHSYSVYTASSVRMRFGRRTATLSIRNKELAEGLANRAAELRGRVLDLLNSGLLEADPEMDFVPRELLAGARDPREREERIRRWRWIGAAALLGLATVLVAAPLQSRRVDDLVWEGARLNGAVRIAEYLDLHAGGRHAGEARVELDRELERGLERLHKLHPGQAAVLGELLEALRRAGTSRVTVEHSPSLKQVRFQVPAGVAMVDVALGELTNVQRQQRVTSALQRRIDKLLGPGVVELRDGLSRSRPPTPSPVKLQVRSELGPSGEVYASSDDPTRRYHGLKMRSAVDVRLDAASAPAHHYDLEAGTDRELKWKEGPRVTPAVAYARLADAAADELGERLVEAMQLSE